ncbi:MAG: protein-L-isoaspartate O-methyltransferase [Gammaproteobacteria bacterium]|jgi:protein-L-isoaspartate(D-aspartate) O-methyltransferase
MDFSAARHNMVASQVRTWDVFAPKVLDAMAELPREDFVPEVYKNLAYADTAIPLSSSQTMLPPKEQGRILQALEIKPDDRVLEICTGTGYLTTLLAQFAKEVVSVDINPEIQAQAKNNLAKHHINNVKLITQDASHGFENHGLFDVIVITGGLPLLPQAYKKLLNVNGRIFAILGKAPIMKATLFTFNANNILSEKILYETVVPMMEHANHLKEFNF